VDFTPAIPVIAVTLGTLFVCRGMIYARPAFERNLAVRLVMNISLVALALEVAFAVLVVVGYLMFPDMSEF
jgi:hypothetical protein